VGIVAQQPRLTAAFLGETRTTGVRYPDLYGPQARGPQSITVTLDPFDNIRTQDQSSTPIK
jgi:hypothetical protein